MIAISMKKKIKIIISFGAFGYVSLLTLLCFGCVAIRNYLSGYTFKTHSEPDKIVVFTKNNVGRNEVSDWQNNEYYFNYEPSPQDFVLNTNDGFYYIVNDAVETGTFCNLYFIRYGSKIDDRIQVNRFYFEGEVTFVGGYSECIFFFEDDEFAFGYNIFDGIVYNEPPDYLNDLDSYYRHFKVGNTLFHKNNNNQITLYYFDKIHTLDFCIVNEKAYKELINNKFDIFNCFSFNEFTYVFFYRPKSNSIVAYKHDWVKNEDSFCGAYKFDRVYPTISIKAFPLLKKE